PRALDGKPALSGVWHHEPTTLEEMKRLFGENAGRANVPGMEIETVSKYGLNILADFKPNETPMRPQAEPIFRRRASGAELRPTCMPVGIPGAGLVSEPVKIAQS